MAPGRKGGEGGGGGGAAGMVTIVTSNNIRTGRKPNHFALYLNKETKNYQTTKKILQRLHALFPKCEINKELSRGV